MTTYQVKVSEKFPDGEAIIYTVDEARELSIDFIPYDNWRSAQYGEYVETVDGYVTPIIKRNDTGDSCHIKTPTGCFHLKRSGTIFDTEEFYNRNTFTRKSRWNGNSPKLTEPQARFFKTFSTTFNLELSIKAAYPYMTKKKDILFWAKQITSSKLFKDYMDKFKDKFEAAGITEEYLINRLKENLDKASPQTFPVLAKMGAAGIGANDMFDELEPKSKQLPARGGAFHQIEDAEIVKEPRQLGAVKNES